MVGRTKEQERKKKEKQKSARKEKLISGGKGTRLGFSKKGTPYYAMTSKKLGKRRNWKETGDYCRQREGKAVLIAGGERRKEERDGCKGGGYYWKRGRRSTQKGGQIKLRTYSSKPQEMPSTLSSSK